MYNSPSVIKHQILKLNILNNYTVPKYEIIKDVLSACIYVHA